MANLTSSRWCASCTTSRSGRFRDVVHDAHHRDEVKFAIGKLQVIGLHLNLLDVRALEQIRRRLQLGEAGFGERDLVGVLGKQETQPAKATADVGCMSESAVADQPADGNLLGSIFVVAAVPVRRVVVAAVVLVRHLLRAGLGRLVGFRLSISHGDHPNNSSGDQPNVRGVKFGASPDIFALPAMVEFLLQNIFDRNLRSRRNARRTLLLHAALRSNLDAGTETGAEDVSMPHGNHRDGELAPYPVRFLEGIRALKRRREEGADAARWFLRHRAEAKARAKGLAVARQDDRAGRTSRRRRGRDQSHDAEVNAVQFLGTVEHDVGGRPVDVDEDPLGLSLALYSGADRGLGGLYEHLPFRPAIPSPSHRQYCPGCLLYTSPS